MKHDKTIRTKTGEQELSLLNHEQGIDDLGFAKIYYDCSCDYYTYFTRQGVLDFTVAHVQEEGSKVKIFPLYQIFNDGHSMQDAYSKFVDESVVDKLEYILQKDFYEPYTSAEIILEDPSIHSEKRSEYPKKKSGFRDLVKEAYEMCNGSADEAMLQYLSLITGTSLEEYAQYSHDLMFSHKTVGGKLGDNISKATSSKDFRFWFPLLMIELEKKFDA